MSKTTPLSSHHKTIVKCLNLLVKLKNSAEALRDVDSTISIDDLCKGIDRFAACVSAHRGDLPDHKETTQNEIPEELRRLLDL